MTQDVLSAFQSLMKFHADGGWKSSRYVWHSTISAFDMAVVVAQTLKGAGFEVFTVEASLDYKNDDQGEWLTTNPATALGLQGDVSLILVDMVGSVGQEDVERRIMRLQSPHATAWKTSPRGWVEKPAPDLPDAEPHKLKALQGLIDAGHVHLQATKLDRDTPHSPPAPRPRRV